LCSTALTHFANAGYRPLKHSEVVNALLQGLCLSAAVSIGIPPTAVSAQNNPIVIENQQPGTSQWRIPWGQAGTDAAGQIKGYGSATSVNKGGNITFYVSTNPRRPPIESIDVTAALIARVAVDCPTIDDRNDASATGRRPGR